MYARGDAIGDGQKNGSPLKSFLFSTNFPFYFSFQKLHFVERLCGAILHFADGERG